MVAIFYITLNKYQPCVCREHASSKCKLPPMIGAPLRVQGTPDDARDGYFDMGSTPACAGNTVKTLHAISHMEFKVSDIYLVCICLL